MRFQWFLSPRIVAALEEKTGWFDTHPSDAERIAWAELALAGEAAMDQPSTVAL